MREITCIQDLDGNSYVSYIPKWWLYDQESGNLICSLVEDYEHIIRTHVAIVSSEIENGLIGIGKNGESFLLWREDEIHPQNINYAYVRNWELKGFTGRKFEPNWTGDLYLTLELGIIWETQPQLPQVQLSGYLQSSKVRTFVTRKGRPHDWRELQSPGTWFEGERISAIVPLTDTTMLAKSAKGRIFLLQGKGYNADEYLGLYDLPAHYAAKAHVLA